MTANCRHIQLKLQLQPEFCPEYCGSYFAASGTNLHGLENFRQTSQILIAVAKVLV